MAEPYVKKAGQRKYVELRERGYTKGDAARVANEVSEPKKPKKAAVSKKKRK